MECSPPRIAVAARARQACTGGLVFTASVRKSGSFHDSCDRSKWPITVERMSDPEAITNLNSAPEGRYRIERELGDG